MRYGVILAGGGGTRLWPLSRRAHPKQFLALVDEGETSLLAATARRLRACCGDQLYVVTTQEQTHLVHRDLPGLPAGQILSEPAPRNTAAAIGLAAAVLGASDPDAVLAIVPADHHIGDDRAFAATCDLAFARAAAGDVIVALGIPPRSPHTGYGYLELAGDASDGDVLRFVEKPDVETAKTYVASGRYWWNAGIFFATAAHWLDLLDTHLPEHGALFREFFAQCRHDRAAALRGAEEAYRQLDAVSVDYGVMEKADRVVALKGDFGWSDVGSFDALADVLRRDHAGNFTAGDVVAIDSTGSIFIADKGLIAACGVGDLIVVRTEDAVLIVPRHQAERVRSIQEELESSSLEGYL